MLAPKLQPINVVRSETPDAKNLAILSCWLPNSVPNNIGIRVESIDVQSIAVACDKPKINTDKPERIVSLLAQKLIHRLVSPSHFLKLSKGMGWYYKWLQ